MALDELEGMAVGATERRGHTDRRSPDRAPLPAERTASRHPRRTVAIFGRRIDELCVHGSRKPPERDGCKRSANGLAVRVVVTPDFSSISLKSLKK